MYHTLQDLFDKLPEKEVQQLVDDEISEDPIVEDEDNVLYKRVTACVKSADSLIDSYCRGRYTVPFDRVPDTIRDVSVSLTIVNLYSRRNGLIENDAVRGREKAALSILEHVQDGRIQLFDSVSAGPVRYSVNKSRSDRVFTKEKLKTF